MQKTAGPALRERGDRRELKVEQRTTARSQCERDPPCPLFLRGGEQPSSPTLLPQREKGEALREPLGKHAGARAGRRGWGGVESGGTRSGGPWRLLMTAFRHGWMSRNGRFSDARHRLVRADRPISCNWSAFRRPSATLQERTATTR